MRQLKLIIGIYVSILLTACSGGVESELQKLVVSRLTDDSNLKRSDIKFGSFTQVDDDHACLTVNPGNMGDMQALFSKKNNKWKYLGVQGRSHESCVEMLATFPSMEGNTATHSASNTTNKVPVDVKKAIIRSLKDPDSAKFGEFTLIDANNACITVNARNSLGGSTGNQQGILTKLNGEWQVLSIDSTISHEACIEVVKRASRKY